MGVFDILRKVIFGIFYFPLRLLVKLFAFLARSTGIIPAFVTFMLILMLIFSALESKFSTFGDDVIAFVICGVIFNWLFRLLANILGVFFSLIASGFAIFAGFFAYLGGYEME